ncbi:MAG: SMC-Scp complex subunit ScpB [bacterium]
MEELRRIIEALLFAAPEPLTMTKILAIVPGTDAKDIVESIEELMREYEGDARAFQVVEVANGWQLASKPDYAIWVDKLFESRGRARLSRAALETLAVVAYKQPVVRSAIESIRGVNVDSVLRTLMERDLVRIVGRADGPGRPLLFGTTKEFLLRFGISRISDLPKLEEIDDLTGDGSAGGQGSGGGEGPAGRDGSGPETDRLREPSQSDLERADYAEAADEVEELIKSSSHDVPLEITEEDTEQDDTEDARDDVAQGEA